MPPNHTAWSHHLTKLFVESEHVWLLHVGPTLVVASLACNYYIIKGRRILLSITKNRVTCKGAKSDSKPLILGQLPSDRLTLGPVFDHVGVDYPGPVLMKSRPISKRSILKSYVAVFICFSTKCMHLKLVSGLTTASFIATLYPFMARRGKPSLIWSDHGGNFVKAAWELVELKALLRLHVGDKREMSLISMPPLTQGHNRLFHSGHAKISIHLWLV